MNRLHFIVQPVFLAITLTVLACDLTLPCAGQVVAEPTSEERLERMCEKFEKERQSLHVPGCSLVVVKNEKIILARGFGVSDVEKNLPVTPETLFAIGSTTKAFTSTLIGMLVDEGKMHWDDHPRKHLPGFAINDPAVDAQITIRDLLCHRAGLANNDMLWYGGGSTRDEIIQTISNAKLLFPFREQFNYNNVMFLAAGEAAGRAEGSGWDAAIAKRIFQPLGMTMSNSSIKAAQPHLSKGYEWDKEGLKYIYKPMRNLDNIGPAGSINSCAIDMGEWLRFLLANGTVDGQVLISKASLDETWTKQINHSGQGYGLGWSLRQFNGRRLVEHSGGIDGFGAHVALLPDDGIGYALLTNVTASALQPTSVSLVFDGLLGPWNESVSPIDLGTAQHYLGTYRFEAMGVDLTVLIQNGNLAVDVPGQIVYELLPPDSRGQWQFAVTDKIAVSFVHDDDGNAIAMKMYQGGLEFEIPRDGVILPVEITLDHAEPYLGTYHSDEMNADLQVQHRNGRLAIDVPNQMVYDLHLPDKDGRWTFRAKNSIAIAFNKDKEGNIVSLTLHQDGHELVAPRIESPPSMLPSLETVLELHRIGHGSEHLQLLGNLRFTGSLDFVHQGLKGKISVVAAGPDRFAKTLDLGSFGFISIALDGPSAWAESSFSDFEKLENEYLQQTRMQHPLLVSADWGLVLERVAVERLDVMNGKDVVVLKLNINKDVNYLCFLDAASGLVLKEEMMLRRPDNAAAMKSVNTYENYRSVKGVMLPMKVTLSNDFTGEMVITFDNVETDIELGSDAFTLKPQAK